MAPVTLEPLTRKLSRFVPLNVISAFPNVEYPALNCAVGILAESRDSPGGKEKVTILAPLPGVASFVKAIQIFE